MDLKVIYDIQIFEVNLSFIAMRDSHLANKIKAYHEHYTTNNNPKRFIVNLINNTYDVLDTKNNTYLYYKSFKEYEQYLCNISLNIDNTIRPISFEYFDENSDKKHYSKYTVKSLNTLRNIFKKHMATFHTINQFHEIDKIIFIGSLLGSHIPKILDKLKNKYCAIVEPDFELFYLSLFFTKYFDIEKSCEVSFYIADDLTHLKNFYLEHFESNYVLKYSLAKPEYAYLLQDIAHIITQANPLNFSFYSMLNVYAKTIDAIKEKSFFLNTKQSYTTFKDNDIVILSPGHSLVEHINWVKINKKSLTILSYAQTLPKLFECGITPDIITILDDKPIYFENFKKVDTEFYKNSYLVCTPNISKKIIKLFDEQKIIFVEKMTNITNFSEQFEGNSVTEFSIFLSIKLGFKNIYLTGVDLTVSTDGSTHDKSHFTYNLYNNDTKSESFEPLQERIAIKSNNNEDVYTTLYFYNSISDIATIISKFKQPHQSVITFSKNGAKIQGVDIAHTYPIANLNTKLNISSLKCHTYMANITKLQTQDIQQEILKLYMNTVPPYFNYLSKSNIMKQQLCKKLHTKIENYFLKLKSKTNLCN